MGCDPRRISHDFERDLSLLTEGLPHFYQFYEIIIPYSDEEFEKLSIGKTNLKRGLARRFSKELYQPYTLVIFTHRRINIHVIYPTGHLGSADRLEMPRIRSTSAGKADSLQKQCHSEDFSSAAV